MKQAKGQRHEDRRCRHATGQLAHGWQKRQQARHEEEQPQPLNRPRRKRSRGPQRQPVEKNPARTHLHRIARRRFRRQHPQHKARHQRRHQRPQRQLHPGRHKRFPPPTRTPPQHAHIEQRNHRQYHHPFPREPLAAQFPTPAPLPLLPPAQSHTQHPSHQRRRRRNRPVHRRPLHERPDCPQLLGRLARIRFVLHDPFAL